MKVVLEPKTRGGCLVVTKEDGERIQKESTFYYQLAKAVKGKYGWDTIRKEMVKDGHMVDDGRFYLVDRKRRFAFFQGDWATYDVCRDYFNCGMEVRLIPHDMRDDTKVPLADWLTAAAA